jgi:hypothetical protein
MAFGCVELSVKAHSAMREHDHSARAGCLLSPKVPESWSRGDRHPVGTADSIACRRFGLPFTKSLLVVLTVYPYTPSTIDLIPNGTLHQ